MGKPEFFKHRPGSGLHYITDNFRIFGDGSYQLGDTSENCILYNLNHVLVMHDLPSLDRLWSQVYPNDLMSLEDLAYIIDTSISFSEWFDPEDPENIIEVLEDVRVIGCGELADEAARLLKEKGIAI